MIGVLHRPDQARVVEEFFELFKTPWEVYQPGRHYDVVIAAVEHIPNLETRLLVNYGSNTSGDGSDGVAVETSQVGGSIRHRGVLIPVFDALTTFRFGNDGSCVVENAEGRCVGVRSRSASQVTVRLGYDLFREVEILLSRGQPAADAHVPTLDLHIEMLRNWILSAGVPLVEIPPVPSGHAFAVCLTHDIDFVGIRRHKFDHTMWGFLYRSTVGAMQDLLRGKISTGRLFRRWRAALALPFVYLGLMKDFWDPFDWYLRVERGMPATYFLIPFKRRAGERVLGRHASRRATAYDVGDISDWSATLAKEGCELGVHGIDAWHSADRGRDELRRVTGAVNGSVVGVRMHWLLCDAATPSVLEKAGFEYDSTAGYNETIGYRNGTSQIFRPVGNETLLELPLHIQDGALFYRQQLDLSEPEADQRCQLLAEHAMRSGGVLTLLWHDRSHGPERFWGEFYERLIARLKAANPWFGTAQQVSSWFRKRRNVRFYNSADGGVRVSQMSGSDTIEPPLVIRRYQASASPSAIASFIDVEWNGKEAWCC